MIGQLDPNSPRAIRLLIVNHVYNMAEAIVAAGVAEEVVTMIVERHCQNALRELAAQVATEQHLFGKGEKDAPVSDKPGD